MEERQGVQQNTGRAIVKQSKGRTRCGGGTSEWHGVSEMQDGGGVESKEGPSSKPNTQPLRI
eukprot:211595-Pelagomonas_calceolata.AAC.2